MLELLYALPPRSFENLVFDLLATSGMQNLSWRTPGSDGGRDIEGELWKPDFSGSSRAERWFIECKRYANAVDWPTVRAKLAYAENHQADFLLMVTTASLSPQCLDEVEQRNSKRASPLIRCWPGHDLVLRLSREPKILLKYKLTDIASVAPQSFFSISMQLAKMTQAAYAAHEFGSSPQRALESAAAIAELMTWRMSDLEKYGRIISQDFDVATDKYPWLQPQGQVARYPIDRCGFRAILSVFRLLTTAEIVQLRSTQGGAIEISGTAKTPHFLESAHTLLTEICFWSDVDYKVLGPKLVVSKRAG